MISNHINAFLSTALGGLIFQYAAKSIKSFFRYLNGYNKDEKFLVNTLKIKPILLRVSPFKYKINTKPYSKISRRFNRTFGIMFLSFSAISFFWTTNLLLTSPIQWVTITHHETNESFWINPGMAKNTPTQKAWSISPETCNTPSALAKITAIKEGTKKDICSYFSSKIENKKIDIKVTKNISMVFFFSAILYLGTGWGIYMGSGMLADVFINKRIAHFNEKEFENSYQYLT